MLDWTEVWRESQHNEPVVVVLRSWVHTTLLPVHRLSFLPLFFLEVLTDLSLVRLSQILTLAHLSGFQHIIFEDIMFTCCLNIPPTHRWHWNTIINVIHLTCQWCYSWLMHIFHYTVRLIFCWILALVYYINLSATILSWNQSFDHVTTNPTCCVSVSASQNCND